MKWRVLGLGALAAVSGCAQVLGLGDFEDAEGTAGSGGSGGAGTTSTSSQGGGATTSTTSSAQGGGGAGQGGDGGQGGAPVCAQGETIPCYTGDPALPGKGACAEGTATCLPDGTGYGDCEGEVLPSAEDCATPTDENCDDQVNEGCACAPGTMAVCYSGAAGTENSAPCKAGFMTCNLDGLGFGPCLGEVTPQAEVCEAQLIDEDCDGTPNDGCTCIPGTNAPCYTGPLGTGNVGLCSTGTHSCLPDGSGYGACLGEITPQAEVCEAGQKDENCDGTANEGCICGPNSTAVCYTGPAGTQGVGICAAGTKTCAGDGLSYGACMGEVVPAAETCGAVADEDCSGADCVVWGKGYALGDLIDAIRADAQGNTYVLLDTPTSVTLGAINLINSGGKDVVLAKLDATGAPLWAKMFGDAADQTAFAMDVDGAGNVVIAGQYNGTMNFGLGALTSQNNDIFVAKFDTNGAAVWNKSFGDNYIQTPKGVSWGPNGDVFLAGQFTGTVNFGGGVLTATGLNNHDIFLTRLGGASGAHVWSSRYGDSSSQYLGGLTVDSAGNPTIVGQYQGTMVIGASTLTATGYDLYLARFDGAGTSSCRTSLASSDSDFFSAVAADSLGSLVAVGSFYNTINFGGGVMTAPGGGSSANIFMTKFSSACLHTWSKSFGSTGGSEYASHVAIDPNNRPLLTMDALGQTDLGGGALPFGGSIDVVVGTFAVDGTHVWSRSYGDAQGQDFPKVASYPGGGMLLGLFNSGVVNFGNGALSVSTPIARLAQ